jgi:hypothetical protein
MESKKFDKLIDLIINENEEQAKDLFHDIVVEKSREIYETIMAEEMMDDDLEEGKGHNMGGKVGDLAAEITAEESGISEDDEEIDVDSEEIFDIDGDDEVEGSIDIEANSSDEVEDAVIRIEDKLDDLMAEFEEIMGKEDDLEARDDDMDADLHDIEDEVADAPEVDVDVNVDDEELVAEAITLQKITAKMGDNGEQTRSPVDANSGQKGMDAHPVDFDKGDESGRPAPTAKDIDGASGYQNQPGKNAKALSAAPKPVTAQATGVNTKSVID